MKRFTLSCLMLLCTALSFAGAFTSGNIVVVRMGTGSAAVSSASQAVFLDEYTPTGTLVQSVALPVAVNGDNHMFTNSGTATSEGALTLSADGRYLSLGGYDAVPGTAAVATTDGINRIIARVGADGVPNTTSGIAVGGAYVKNNMRGAVSNDGTGFWTSGAATSGSTTGGVYYVPFGSLASTPVQLSSSLTNTRVINIYGGQLYVSSSSSSYHGVNSVGTGLPTTGSQTITNLPGFPGSDTASSQYAFYFADLSSSVPGVDVVYVCDDRTAGGLLKYSLVSGTWVSNGSVTPPTSIRGMTGSVSGSTAQLYVTSESAIYSISDASGYNQTITGTFASIASAATNTKLRGVAFTPAAVVCNMTAGISSTNVTCNGGNNGTATASATGGSGTYTYSWGNNVTGANRTNLTAATYNVTANDGAGCTASATATITQPTAINIVDTVTNLPCNGGNNGGVHIGVSGGTPGYKFLWNTTNNDTTQDVDNLSVAQTYTVTVSDAAHCTATASASVSQSGDLAVLDTIINVKCNGDANGSINIGVTGGTPTYTYSWTGSIHTPDISGLQPGAYTLTVTDNGGCTLINTYTLGQPDTITIAANLTNVSTPNGANGSINLTVTGGTVSYTYAWDNSPSTSADLSGLREGTYCVTVTDRNQCEKSDCYTLSAPSAINETAWVQQFNTYVAGSILNVTATYTNEMNSWLEVYDIAGNFITTQYLGKSSHIQTTVGVGGLASGCYLVRLNTEQGPATHKVIIAN